MIAADVTTMTTVVFPKDAERYSSKTGSITPGQYVRASMSIPIFFQPFKVQQLVNAGQPAEKYKGSWGFYKGTIPEKVRQSEWCDDTFVFSWLY